MKSALSSASLCACAQSTSRGEELTNGLNLRWHEVCCTARLGRLGTSGLALGLGMERRPLAVCSWPVHRDL